MASQYPGRGAALGVGVEGTWGTWQSAQEWVRIISSDLRRVTPKQPRPHLVSSAIPMRRRHYIESDMVTGPIVMEAEYHSLALFLEWAMGTSATSGVGPYSHLQTLASELPFGLSFDLVRGEGGTSDKFEGCMCTSFDLSVSAGGGPMVATYNVLGQTSTARTSISTPTHNTVSAPVLYHQCDSDFTWNSVAYKVIDWRLNVDNAIAQPRLRLGSLNPLQPKRNDYMGVSCTVTLEVEDALTTGYIADTESDWTLGFHGAADYEINIEGHNAYISDVSDPVDRSGILQQTVTFVMQSDGTDYGLEIQVINNESDNRAIEDS